MKFGFLYGFSGLLSSEACSLCGLIASLTSSPFAEIAMRHTRKRQIGYVPVPPSARRSLSSVGLDWEAWPMRWITKQSLSMRTSLISHGAQVSTTHPSATCKSLAERELKSTCPTWHWSQSLSGEMCVRGKKNH